MEMNRAQIMELLDGLIEECLGRGITGTVAIYGGTAMAYHSPDLRTTQDVDSMFKPYETIHDAAQCVAQCHQVPADWLNMQIHDIMPPVADDDPQVYFDRDGLRVTFASKPYLLAMKAMSDRRSQKDLDDAAELFNLLGLSSWMDIDELVHRYYGKGSAGAQELFFEDIEDRALEMSREASSGRQ